MARPPAYDLVLQDESETLYASTVISSGRHQPEFTISVSDPVKQGEGVTAFVAFKIRTRTTHPAFTAPVAEVTRRFSHFSWLHQKLTEKHRGCIVPSLPEKSTVQKFQMATDFIEQRRRALEVFLTKVVAHPVLKDSRELQLFLQAAEHEWTAEMARWQAESNAAKPPAVNGALQWLRSLQHSASNMVSGRSDDAMEDAEYIRVRDYINNLEGHLVEAHRQAGRLVRKEVQLSSALAEFGIAAEHLGKLDDGLVRGTFDVLCARSGQIATASKSRADAMAVSFEAPLKESARTIKGVQTAMADRAAALSTFAQAKSELDGRKVRLAKLRGTPGLKEEKISDAERDVAEGEARQHEARIAYDTIVARMTEELNRFQKERAAEMSQLLREFALAQASAAAENARAWSAMLHDMQTIQTQTTQAGSVAC
ncbi:subunit of retromer complex [Haematococcus lacustris]